MQIDTEAKALDFNQIEISALAAFNSSNVLLMALEGLGKHAMEPGDEKQALTELALSIRNANHDLLTACGIERS